MIRSCQASLRRLQVSGSSAPNEIASVTLPVAPVRLRYPPAIPEGPGLSIHPRIGSLIQLERSELKGEGLVNALFGAVGPCSQHFLNVLIF